MTVTQQALLQKDAENRAWRSFLQGLAIDVAVAAAITVYQIVSDPKPIVWAIVGASLARSVAQAAASYVMRRFLDGSKVPTPLPPDPPGEPDNDVVVRKTPAKKTTKRTAKKTTRRRKT